MTSVASFRRKLTSALAAQSRSVHAWGGGARASANLLDVSSSSGPTILYVKEFNVPSKPGFWGLTKNQLTRIQSSKDKWFVILLLRSDSAGYLLTAMDARNGITSGQFELNSDGDYKINERDLASSHTFASVAQLVQRI